ncbi:hypothetical protein [Comamonas koreensis]|uniref:Uncharacterized protein n=1 Tax=Comamonas koreensis TaxID=160825 RepID=A0AAW4XTN3_9BURK|nr:hypothetical protein [Comamonas koreensis]MCD2164076.1 hypothetical protein [Comamonas koreensis]
MPTPDEKNDAMFQHYVEAFWAFSCTPPQLLAVSELLEQTEQFASHPFAQP